MTSSKRRKTAALALALIGVAGLSIASAAQLNLGTDSLGAGTTVVASCQPSTVPIGVRFANAYSAGEYRATGVTLTSVDAACVGQNVRITLTDASGAALGTELSGTVTAAGSTTISVSPAVAAKAITGVAVVIFS